MVERLNACPEEILRQRRASYRLSCERFGVVRFRGNVACDHDFYWSFDNLDDAKSLCSFLVTEELGAYVFDTVNRKKVYELALPPA